MGREVSVKILEWGEDRELQVYEGYTFELKNSTGLLYALFTPLAYLAPNELGENWFPPVICIGGSPHVLPAVYELGNNPFPPITQRLPEKTDRKTMASTVDTGYGWGGILPLEGVFQYDWTQILQKTRTSVADFCPEFYGQLIELRKQLGDQTWGKYLLYSFSGPDPAGFHHEAKQTRRMGRLEDADLTACKLRAKVLRLVLEENGLRIGYNHSLKCVAAMFGRPSWQALTEDVPRNQNTANNRGTFWERLTQYGLKVTLQEAAYLMLASEPGFIEPD